MKLKTAERVCAGVCLTLLIAAVILISARMNTSALPAASVTTPEPAGVSEAFSASSGGESVNINTADEELLETLPGIGPSLALRIIEYRTEYGPFTSAEDIIDVSGIGLSTYEKLKDKITVEQES